MKLSATVLVVEDDLLDVKQISRSFDRASVGNPVVFARDGESAHETLSELADANHGSLPGLVLLDLNLPRMSGLEILGACRADPRFGEIPFVVMTTSDEPSDRARAEELGAAAYLYKPIDFERLDEAVRKTPFRWSFRKDDDPDG